MGVSYVLLPSHLTINYRGIYTNTEIALAMIKVVLQTDRQKNTRINQCQQKHTPLGSGKYRSTQKIQQMR